MRVPTEAIENVARTRLPILLLGEPGVGKRDVAREIHTAGPWKDSPYLEVDCRNLDPTALRAAFEAGAAEETATVYLDHVDALPPPLQRQLLACMEAESSRATPVRVISSASDLENEVRNGSFREDLYYRLNSVCIPIPPLRYRQQEIEAFANEYLEKYSKQFNRPKPEVTVQLLRFIHSHSWPGNLTELEDAMRTVVAVGDARVAIAALNSGKSGERDKRSGHESVSLLQVARAASQRAERDVILKALSRTNWNRKKAAEELKISYKTLLYKLKEIGNTAGTAVAPGGKG